MKDDAEYTNVDENTYQIGMGSVNEKMDRVGSDGADWCELNGGDVLSLVQIQR